LSNLSKVDTYSADCVNCFALCCVALPYAKSADFATNKEGGAPCDNLKEDYRCRIHKNLRNEGFRGCTVYECYGAGQKVSQFTYSGKDWREFPESANEMFSVFPIMQQLHEMLRYLEEALSFKETLPIKDDIQKTKKSIERLTFQSPQSILELKVHEERIIVSDLLTQTSELVRKNVTNQPKNPISKRNLIGAKLNGANLRGTDLRGALLIAADLREADMSTTDLLGADLRDANLNGANLTGSIFLTQAQINSANGNRLTKLPDTIVHPAHWLE
jgi:uncharacterized protein YjbI with pentapeptide repeats